MNTELNLNKAASSIDHLTAVYRQYGTSPLACHAFLRDARNHCYQNSYISYQSIANHSFVLGDPVGPMNERRSVIKRFIDLSKHTTFVQISESTSKILREFGFLVTPFGVESKINLPFSIEGKEKSDLRLLYNRGIDSGLQFRELSTDDVYNENLQEWQMSEKWQTRKIGSCFSFLGWGEVKVSCPDIRLFGGFINGNLIGFSLFGAIYEDGILKGYTELLSRRTLNATKGTRVFILVEALKQFQHENIEFANLGLSPFKDTNKYQTGSSIVTSSIFRFLFNYGTIFFNFHGLSFHKSRFRGEESAVHFASKSKLPLLELLRIFRLTTGRWMPS